MTTRPSIFKRLMRPLVNNDVRTGDSGWYPELEPHRYEADREAVLEAILAVIEARDRWEVVDVDRREGVVEAEVRSRIVGFVDDLTVEVEEEGEKCVVGARSRSRVGKGDLGQNARTIREFLDLLDERLGGAA